MASASLPLSPAPIQFGTDGWRGAAMKRHCCHTFDRRGQQRCRLVAGALKIMLPVGDRLQIELARFTQRGGLHMRGQNLHQHRGLRPLRGFGRKLERQGHKPVTQCQRDITAELRPDSRPAAAQPVTMVPCG